MNEVLKNIMNRRSIRKFKSDAVSREDIQIVAEAGSYAASGRGLQSPVIIAVTDKDVLARLVKINAEILGKPDMNPFYGAPAVLIVLADTSKPTYLYDGSLVLGNMMLAAKSIGLGSCWIHRAKQEFELPEWKDFLKKLGIEGNYEGIGHLALGYPEIDPDKPLPRKNGYIYFI